MRIIIFFAPLIFLIACGDNGKSAISDSGIGWDLAFKSASILTNSRDSRPDKGGGLVLSGVYCDDPSELPMSGWQIDANGPLTIAWDESYTYAEGESYPPHIILTNPGIGLDVCTADGRYARL